MYEGEDEQFRKRFFEFDTFPIVKMNPFFKTNRSFDGGIVTMM